MAMKEWGMNEKNNILSPSLKMICLDAERTGLWQDGRGGGGVQVGVTEKVCAMFLKYLESHSKVIYKL